VRKSAAELALVTVRLAILSVPSLGHGRLVMRLLGVQPLLEVLVVGLALRSVGVLGHLAPVELLLLGARQPARWTQGWRLVHQVELLLHLLDVGRSHVHVLGPSARRRLDEVGLLAR